MDLLTIGVLNIAHLWTYYTIAAVEEYVRSWEQNEELGLNDMDTTAADVAYSSAADAEPSKSAGNW